MKLLVVGKSSFSDADPLADYADATYVRATFSDNLHEKNVDDFDMIFMIDGAGGYDSNDVKHV